MKLKSSLVLISLFLCSMQYEVFAYYSSKEDLYKLFETEISRIQLVEEFMQALEQRNEYINSFLLTVESDIKLYTEDRLGYFGNPIRAYKSIRKFINVWTFMEHLIVNATEVHEFQQNMHKLPMQSNKLSNIQLRVAVEGILRLQQKFGLTTTEIADGISPGGNTTKLSVNDCFQLGRIAYELQQYRQAVSWLQEAYIRFEQLLLNAQDKWGETPTLEIFFDTLEYLARSMNKLGNNKMADRYTEILLLVQPKNTYALEFQATYKRVKPITFDATIARKKWMPLI